MLTDSSKQKQHGERWEQRCFAIASFLNAYAMFPGRKTSILFFPFLLPGDNSPPSAINVDAITFHNWWNLQALFYGCWSKNSGISLLHSPGRGDWSLGGPIAYQACHHKSKSLSNFHSIYNWSDLRKPHVSQFGEVLPDSLGMFDMTCLKQMPPALSTQTHSWTLQEKLLAAILKLLP